MFSSSHKARGRPAPAQTISPYALAAARATIPPRSQTPTLSQSAAAAALHASPKVSVSPATVVTRRMERRNSQTSVTSSVPGGPVRRGSDSSMSERIGRLRDGTEGSNQNGNNSRPGSKSSNRPMSQDRMQERMSTMSPTRLVPINEIKKVTKPRTQIETANRSDPIRIPDGTGDISMRKSLQATSTEEAATTPVRKKTIQTQSETEGNRLTRGTMRDDADRTYDFLPARDQLNSQANAPQSSLRQSMHAQVEQSRSAGQNASVVSDEVKALALAIMQQQQAASSRVIGLEPSKRAQRRERNMIPDTIDGDNDSSSAEENDDNDHVSNRHSYAGSVSSAASFASDLESIPEEQGNLRTRRDAKKKREKGILRESIIIPGRDGVPDLPHSPILEQEKTRLAQAKIMAIPIEKLSPIQDVPKVPNNDNIGSQISERTAFGKEAEDLKLSPPSSATLTEEPFQPVIQTIPPTPPAISDNDIGNNFSIPDTGLEENDESGFDERALQPRFRSSPRVESPLQKVLKGSRRHSPPPRSSSPAKSAMKHHHVYEGSDRSSIVSAEENSVVGSISGKRKSTRVSFSEDPNIVEMDDNQYRYEPIRSNIKPSNGPKQLTKGISDVSFSSISRNRAEHTPEPERQALGSSTDLRIGGTLGSEILDRIRSKTTIEPYHSEIPVSPYTDPSHRKSEPVVSNARGGPLPRDPSAPEIVSTNPPASNSSEGFGVEIYRPNSMPLSTVVNHQTKASNNVQESYDQRNTHIGTGRTSSIVDIRPIFPPDTADLNGTIATLPQNIAQGHAMQLGKDNETDSDNDSIYSDAYEDLDRVVLSPTGTGAIIGVTAGPKIQNSITPASDNLVLPNINEVVTEQPSVITGISNITRSLGLNAAECPLPEEAISDKRDVGKDVISPQSNTNTRIPVIQETRRSSEMVAISKQTKPASASNKVPVAQKKSTPQVISGTKTSTGQARATDQGNQSRTQNQRKAITPSVQRTLSVSSSEGSESSFQKENPHRKDNRLSKSGGGFTMRTSMRNSVDTATPAQDSGLSHSRWAGASSPAFESGFRSGRTMGSTAPRIRNYSPDSSDEDRKVTPKGQNNDRKSGFLGKGTLRSAGVSSSMSIAPATQSKDKAGKGGFTGFRSRFEDSSDEEDNSVAAYKPSAPVLSSTRRFSPSSSEEDLSQVNGQAVPPTKTNNKSSSSTFLGKSTLRDSAFVPAAGSSALHGNLIEISAENLDKKKWWNFGSRGSSRPSSRAGSVIVPPTSMRPTLDRRTTDPDKFSTPPRGNMKKFRKTSSGSVNSVQSSATWTPTSTVDNPGPGKAFSHKLSGLQEEDENEVAPNSTSKAGNLISENTQLQTQKKKRFPKLRKMFGIED